MTAEVQAFESVHDSRNLSARPVALQGSEYMNDTYLEAYKVCKQYEG